MQRDKNLTGFPVASLEDERIRLSKFVGRKTKDMGNINPKKDKIVCYSFSD